MYCTQKLSDISTIYDDYTRYKEVKTTKKQSFHPTTNGIEDIYDIPIEEINKLMLLSESDESEEEEDDE